MESLTDWPPDLSDLLTYSLACLLTHLFTRSLRMESLTE